MPSVGPRPSLLTNQVGVPLIWASGQQSERTSSSSLFPQLNLSIYIDEVNFEKLRTSRQCIMKSRPRTDGCWEMLQLHARTRGCTCHG
jgi:hypothetical protein